MADYVLARRRDSGDKVALSVLHETGSENWTYADLAGAVQGAATGLIRAGLRPGERVLMRLDNTVAFPIAYQAAIAAGLVPVPASAALTTTEINEIAHQCAPSLIVAAPGVSLPDPLPCPLISADELTGMYGLPPTAFRPLHPDDPAYVVFTSGTSGRPRGVVHAHRAVWARRMMWDGWYGLREDDRLFHAGAFNWTFTLGTGLMDPWAAGATALIPGDGIRTEMIADLLRKHDATLFAAAPGIYRRLLKGPVPPLPALRHGLSAGEKLPDATRADWTNATGTPIHEAFGMSECSTFISGAPGHPAPDGTLGYPQKGRKVAILADGEPVAIGQPGVLAMARSDPGLMLEYLNAPDETAARMQGDWFLTGDMASMAQDGAITYLGRNDDMMNAGGVRVSPIEVEAALRSHPGVEDCAAVEVAIKPGVSVIALFYTGPKALSHQQLADHAAGVLARYKQPRLYLHRDRLPHGANNKLLRRQLRAEFENAPRPPDRG